MSCNGCRVLRKGCSETCTLRSSIQWIENPEAQGYATLFVAKFFGRADLMSFISAVPHHQRPALFQSLLFEACGRTVNPVNGAVGLLMSGNWHICQAAVQTVFSGGILRPISPELLSRVLTINTNSHHQPNNNNKPEQKTTSNTPDVFRIDDSSNRNMRFQIPIPNVDDNRAYNKAQRNGSAVVHSQRSSLMKMAEEEEEDGRRRQIMNNRDSSPSEVSGTTGSFENYEAAATVGINGGQKRKLLNLFI